MTILRCLRTLPARTCYPCMVRTCYVCCSRAGASLVYFLCPSRVYCGAAVLETCLLLGSHTVAAVTTWCDRGLLLLDLGSDRKRQFASSASR